MESSFGTLKQELVHRRADLAREEARVSLFDDIEVFYNRQRLHSTLGYLSPVQYEESRKLPQVGAHKTWGRSIVPTSSHGSNFRSSNSR